MSELYQSLSHSKWDCKYHVAFRAQAAAQSNLRQTRRQLGQIFHALAKQKECQIVEGRLMSDHVHKITRSVLAKAFRGELVQSEAALAKAEGRSNETAEELLVRIKEQQNGDKPTLQRQRKVAVRRG